MESIGDNCFYYCKLREIVIPRSVHSIGDHAFDGCPWLSSLRFEEGSQISNIGRGAFYSTQLTPNNVKYPDTFKSDGREYE